MTKERNSFSVDKEEEHDSAYLTFSDAELVSSKDLRNDSCFMKEVFLIIVF